MGKKSFTDEEFDAELAVKNPLVIRVGNYRNNRTKIEFKCVFHNEVHLGRPKDILRGNRLSCCWGSNGIRRKRAANDYDKKLKIKNPNVVRLESYISSKVKILHKCLIHDEIHKARPDNCLSGQGLYCCGSRLNTFSYAIKFSKNPTQLYLFDLKRFSSYVKIGISKDIEKRKDEEYGEKILLKRLNSRAEAYTIEQAILQDKRLTNLCPEEMYINKWPGWTEVRKCSRDVARQVVESYLTELETLGLNVFAKKYLALTRSEKALLDKKYPPP
jgi:hypothetical protein